MKLVKKSLLALATAAAMATPAFAALNNVGGIVWEPDAGLPFPDFIGIGSFVQTQTSPFAGGVLSGYAVISTLNGTSNFCQAGAGCELTYVFNNFVQTSASPGLPKSFSGGTVDFYVDTGTTATSAATAGDGTLWASFVARADSLGVTLSVVLNGGAAQASGALDVTGGLAFAALDTNSYNSFLADPVLWGADLTFSNTTSNLISGGTTFVGDTIHVPEPGSLALLGLGLVGLAAARRRKAA